MGRDDGASDDEAARTRLRRLTADVQAQEAREREAEARHEAERQSAERRCRAEVQELVTTFLDTMHAARGPGGKRPGEERAWRHLPNAPGWIAGLVEAAQWFGVGASVRGWLLQEYIPGGWDESGTDGLFLDERGGFYRCGDRRPRLVWSEHIDVCKTGALGPDRVARLMARRLAEYSVRV